MDQFLNLDLTQLSYGALFVWLLLDTTKKSSVREDKLINALNKLDNVALAIENNNTKLETLNEDVKTIKEKVGV